MPHPRRHAPRAEPDQLNRAGGIHRIPLPTPWPVGPVNVYLVEDDPLTLVDTGAHSDTSLAALEAALQELGYSVDDLERVVVTHQHLDHGGAAHALIERSGAELCALEGLTDWFASYPASIEAEDALAGRVLHRHGAGEEALRAVWEHNIDARRYGTSATVTKPLVDGASLEFADRTWQVLHRPGHSPSDTLFFDAAQGILLAGDILLADVRSSALIAPPLDGSEVSVRPRAFAQYLRSLRRLDAMELELVLPGHGEPFGDHRELIARRLSRYDATTERIGGLLRSEPRTASQLAQEFRGSVPDSATFFMLCEVLGHLDRLVDQGAAIETDVAAVKRFARAA